MPFTVGHKLARGGYRPGSGRKSKAAESDMYELFEEAVTREDKIQILKVMCREAKGGSVKAAAFLFDRMYGKPVERVEVDMQEEDADGFDLSLLTGDELEFLDRIKYKLTEQAEDPGGEVQAIAR